MYSGEKCQIESSQMKAIKSTIQFTSILAILIIIMFYLMFVLIDICNFYASRKKVTLKKPRENIKTTLKKCNGKKLFKLLKKEIEVYERWKLTE